MVMIVSESCNNTGAELVGLGMRQFQRGYFLQMIMQQPGMVNERLQDQRLAAGHRAALAAHDRAGRQLGTGGLVGSGCDRGRSPRSRPPAAASGGESARLIRSARSKRAR